MAIATKFWDELSKYLGAAVKPAWFEDTQLVLA